MTDHESIDQGFTVGRVSDLVGITVRTLHHWDAIGLVRPSRRGSGAYRLYSDDDIARLLRVLVYRELGFPLTEIGRLLDDPTVDAREHLRRQRAELASRMGRLSDMLGAVDRMLRAAERGIRLTAEEQAEIFGADWDPARIAEAEERWGDTPAWTENAERAATRDRDDWVGVADRMRALTRDLGDAVRRGVRPGDPEAEELVDRHRAAVSEHYECTRSMQVCLARMYVADPRFTAHYDAEHPGLALWLRDAVFASANSHGIDPETAAWE